MGGIAVPIWIRLVRNPEERSLKLPFFADHDFELSRQIATLRHRQSTTQSSRCSRSCEAAAGGRVLAPVAQLEERLASNQQVAGSSPAGRSTFAERQIYPLMHALMHMQTRA